jgi:hypothetical protein
MSLRTTATVLHGRNIAVMITAGFSILGAIIVALARSHAAGESA